MSADMPYHFDLGEPELVDEELEARLAELKRRAADLTPITDDHDLEEAIEAAATRIAGPIAHQTPAGG